MLGMPSVLVGEGVGQGAGQRVEPARLVNTVHRLLRLHWKNVSLIQELRIG